VGVDDDRVGRLPAGEGRPTIGQQGDDAGIRRVYVKPDPLCRGDLGDGRHRIDGRGAGRPHGCDDCAGDPAGVPILDDRPPQGVRVHRQLVIDSDPPQPLTSEAERHARLLDGAMRLGRGVHAQTNALAESGRGGSDRRLLAGRCQPHQGARRGCVRDKHRIPRQRGQQPADSDLLELVAPTVRQSMALATSVDMSISPRMPATPCLGSRP
jgi:hypothetical protein